MTTGSHASDAELAAEHDPEIFTVSDTGSRASMTMDAAVHGGGLRHLVLDFGSRS